MLIRHKYKESFTPITFHLSILASILVAPADYTAIVDHMVTLDSSNTAQTIAVPIVLDNRVEGNENFFAQLVFQVFDRQVEIDPNVTRVSIIDDDSEQSSAVIVGTSVLITVVSLQPLASPLLGQCIGSLKLLELEECLCNS